MEDYIYTLEEYLPVKFKDKINLDFIIYHENAFIENINNEKYQFAFKAFHMLYMVFIYKTIWILKKTSHPEILKDQKEYKIKAKSTPVSIETTNILINEMFHQSQLHETNSIKDLISNLGGFDGNDIDKCSNHVTVRNHCSHASGKIEYDKKAIDHFINDELIYIERIQNKIQPQLKLILEKFISENWDNNWIEDNLDEWIMANFFSKKDITMILQITPAFLKQASNNKENIYKKILYCGLVSELTKHVEEKKDYFTKSLSALMKGMVKEIDIKKDSGDADKIRKTQELIDEKIVPFLTYLSSEESTKAQEILQLNVTE